ncbi:MAG: YqaA family protein [Anaerolineae bacterium]
MEKPKEWAKSRVTRGYWRLLALLPIVIISLVLILLRDRLAHFKTYGYSGIFLISLLGNATIILPAPSLAVVFAMGGALNPIVVGLAAGIGEALGELTGFLAGYGGRVVIEDRELYARLEGWMKRYGLVVIIVLSAIPNPFFDLAGIAAGALRFPLWQFLVACWLGKTIKTVIIALIGARSIYFLERFF